MNLSNSAALNNRRGAGGKAQGRSLVWCTFLVAGCLFACASCSSLETRNLSPSPFLEHGSALQPLPQRSPFQGNWFAGRGELDDLRKTFNQIHVRPVNTSFILFEENPAAPGRRTSSAAPEDIREMADFMDRSLRAAFSAGTRVKWSVVTSPGPRTFVLGAALVELNPTGAALNAAKSVAGFFIPGAPLVSAAISVGAGAVADAAADGSIAIEVKVWNGETGKLLAEFFDRREDRSALIVNLNDYSAYGNARRAVEEWAEHLVELLETGSEHQVERSAAFSLIIF